MSPQVFRRPIAAATMFALSVPFCLAQEVTPASAGKGTSTLSVDAKLVIVPAVVFEKKGLVTTLSQNDFSITVDGKPQTVRYFDRDADVPLTVGLLADVSRSQSSVLDDEQKASEKFLSSFLRPAGGNRPADRAFVLQFAHSAELLQDVTDSHPLLAAGLKQIGTQAPGSPDEDASTQSKDNGGSTSSNPNSGNSPNSPNSPGNGGYGPYGRRGGYPGGGGGGSNSGNNGSYHRGEEARSGTVLYDSIFLASDDVLSRQKGRRALVVLTDGVDRHSKESLTEAIEAAQRADTVIYAIYFKGREPHNWGPRPGGYDPYGGGGYDPYGYPPTTGGSTDPGTYRDPDGKKILTRICTETGGRMFELKGKGSLDDIYKQIGDELRAQYRLGFTPTYEAASPGFHPIQLTLTTPGAKNYDVQTRIGYYTGAPKPQ